MMVVAVPPLAMMTMPSPPMLGAHLALIDGIHGIHHLRHLVTAN
jgi:hypothetical protein